MRSVDYPVDDLLGDKLTTADVGKWIETLIAPDSWQSAGGDGTITAAEESLRIEQTQAVQYQVLFFLERIRLAKQLPLRSKYPARLLSGQPYGAGVADRLNAPATFTFSHDTPLAEVFHYWQGEAGLPIFVDWPALASVGLWPDSRITCTSANEPWRTAFDKILGPLDLAGWRSAGRRDPNHVPRPGRNRTGGRYLPRRHMAGRRSGCGGHRRPGERADVRAGLGGRAAAIVPGEALLSGYAHTSTAAPSTRSTASAMRRQPAIMSSNCGEVQRLVAVAHRLLGVRDGLRRSGRRRRRRSAAAAIAARGCVWPVPWLGSTTTGRCVLLLQVGHGRQRQREARVGLERADAALAEHHVAGCRR